MNARPIGVFDSGVGGLSVLREIRALLPAEDVLYVADSASLPYGEKAPDVVYARAAAITRFLLEQRAKAIVVACNTASSAALARLRAQFAAPIIGMEPALKPAAARTRSGVVGVLATQNTLAGEKFAQLLDRFGHGVQVQVQPCPGWVERVEAGELRSAATRALVERHVTPLLERGADTLVLGCTHYPFLRPLIEDIAGPGVAVIDPSPAVAREVQRRLEAENLLATTTRSGTERFCTSGVAEVVARSIERLWGAPVAVVPLAEFAPDAACDSMRTAT